MVLTCVRMLLGAAATCLWAGGPQVALWERSFSTVRDRVTLLPPEQFEVSRVESVARDFLAAARGFRLAQCYFFPSEGEANQYLSGKLVNHVAYQWWRKLYEAELRQRNPVAWVFMLEGSAVLLLRDRKGEIHRRVLVGNDPTRLWMGGERWDILDVTVSEVPEFLRPREGDVRLKFYIRTTAALPNELCAAVTKALAGATKVTATSALFRNDHWFVTDPFFPVAYAFEPLGPPISESEYRKSRTVYCSVLHGEPTC